jgi:Skp family chaperone for outer membrane proteins
MKKLFSTFIFSLFFIVTIFAQTTGETVINTQESLKTCAKQLSELVSSIETIKKKGKKEFAKEQTEIDAKRTNLNKRKAAYDAGKEKEAVMPYGAWEERVALNTKLLEEEQAINMQQLKLAARRDDFNIRMKQLENSLAVFSEDILARANQFIGQIETMNGKIGKEDY